MGSISFGLLYDSNVRTMRRKRLPSILFHGAGNSSAFVIHTYVLACPVSSTFSAITHPSFRFILVSMIMNHAQRPTLDATRSSKAKEKKAYNNTPSTQQYPILHQDPPLASFLKSSSAPPSLVPEHYSQYLIDVKTPCLPKHPTSSSRHNPPL